MLEIRVITKDEYVDPNKRKQVAGVSGIYALVDPESQIPRYVGSSNHIQARLHQHHHGFTGREARRRKEWLRELVSQGLFAEAWVLEECEVGDRQSIVRLERERHWIKVCHDLFGGADLNGALTPVGHAASKDSKGKLMYEEVRKLKNRIKELEAELETFCDFGVQHCNACNAEQHVARCAAPDPSTQRTAGL